MPYFCKDKIEINSLKNKYDARDFRIGEIKNMAIKSIQMHS